jgi:LysR family nitrogen assimilation transcriptional regulator
MQRELILNNRIEMALLSEPDERPAPHERAPLFRQRLALLCGPEDLRDQGRPIALADLARRPVALPGRDNPVRTALDRAAAERGILLAASAELNSMPIVKAAVRAGVGPAVSYWIPEDPGGAPDGLVYRPIVEPEIELTISLCTSRLASPTPASLAVQEIVRGVVAERVRRPGWTGAALLATS